jgi:hypothetical protein
MIIDKTVSTTSSLKCHFILSLINMAQFGLSVSHHYFLPHLMRIHTSKTALLSSHDKKDNKKAHDAMAPTNTMAATSSCLQKRSEGVVSSAAAIRSPMTSQGKRRRRWGPRTSHLAMASYASLSSVASSLPEGNARKLYLFTTTLPFSLNATEDDTILMIVL